MTETRASSIPNEAWSHASIAVFRDGHLYPDTVRLSPDKSMSLYPDSDDQNAIEWLSHFTLENYHEWAGAVVLCPRGPRLEEVMVRFDEAPAFIANGYRNPYREPGVPDWYFFWTRFHTMGTLKKFAREVGLLPPKDLPMGVGGYGTETGLRGHGRGIFSNAG